MRSDGRPTYNFASPVEDWLDGITHVIRGDDHVSNTPKQINVLHALGAEPARVRARPNVFGDDGKKLSKRHGAVSVDEFREAGYVAAALMNFLALLGWAPDGETTIMSRDELVERFSLERVGSSPATFDYAKLDWMNGVYLRALAPDEYADALVALPPASRGSTGTRRASARWRRSCRRRSGGSASSPGSRASCSTTSSPTRRCSTARSSRRRQARSRGRALGGGAHRDSAEGSSARSSGRSRGPSSPPIRVAVDRARGCRRGCTRPWSSSDARRRSSGCARERRGAAA